MAVNRKYDYEQADKLENHVRSRYRSQLSNGAMQLYFSLAYLEKKGLGLGHPITATYKDLGAASFKDPTGIRKLLEALNGLLCEVEYGSPIKEDKKATQIRRYTLKELMSGNTARRLIDYTPVKAQDLVEKLNQHSFTYGESLQCQPFWHASRTGRVISRNPNVQGDPKNVRVRHLCAGLQPDECLFHLDFKRAEPTIIQQVVGIDLKSCPYEALSSIQSISRSEAKQQVNMLAYSRSAVKIVGFWPTKAYEFFMPYAEALEAYKDKLWMVGKPSGTKKRFVQTLGGTRIDADRGERAHRGQLLNWHIQGTVADIVNSACLKILDQAGERGWRFCYPVHDAVYVIGRPEHGSELQVVMEHEARRLGLDMKADLDIFHSNTAVRKNLQSPPPLPVRKTESLSQF